MIEPLSGYKANNNGYTSDNIIELMLSYFIMPASRFRQTPIWQQCDGCDVQKLCNLKIKNP